MDAALRSQEGDSLAKLSSEKSSGSPALDCSTSPQRNAGDAERCEHPDHPSYEDACCQLARNMVGDFNEKAERIVREYFVSSDVNEVNQRLTELGCPEYRQYFVKKLMSMAMDRSDRAKELAAVLLLEAEGLDGEHLVQGFLKLLQAADNLAVDIPEAADVMALFLARAIIDGLLPSAFLVQARSLFNAESRAMEVILKASDYLTEDEDAVLQRWGGQVEEKEVTAEQIDSLLQAYVKTGDKDAACRRINELSLKHHELVKRSLLLATDNGLQAEISALLKSCADEGVISRSQMKKGFNRFAMAHPLEPVDGNQPIVDRASEVGWIRTSSPTDGCQLKDGKLAAAPQGIGKGGTVLKEKLTAIAQEYFWSDDMQEVVRSLKDLEGVAGNVTASFIRRLILLAMERKNREREMASLLLPWLAMAEGLSSSSESEAQVVEAFMLLLEQAEDTGLDIPDAATQLAFFLARAVYDDVLPPYCLEEMKAKLKSELGKEIASAAKNMSAARHGGERLTRCWGGGTGWAIEDAKDKIAKLLEEYEVGGDPSEACRCIRELDMAFFHHEIVKRAVEIAMEQCSSSSSSSGSSSRMEKLLRRCAEEGLITSSQMWKGFHRVLDSLDDLALDIPDAHSKFRDCVRTAKQEGWLCSTFTLLEDA